MRTLTRDAIQALQLQRLLDLRAQLVPANAFYTPRLSVPFASLEEFSAAVPFTTKSELAADQHAHPPFGTNLTFPLSAYTRFCQTSSTTGSPLRWPDTQQSWDWMLGCWERVFLEAGVGAGHRVFFAFSFGPFLGFWTAFDAATRLGCMAIPGGGFSSTARLRMLLDLQANVLCCTPTYAIRLAEVAAAEGVDLTRSAVSVLIVAGEPGGSVPGTRALLERLWPSTRVFDHHGMTETGPVSFACSRRPRVLHIIESAFYAEIVNPHSGAPLPHGESGELVLTTLGRIGSPVLRYRTGDLVQSLPPGVCECGSAELALAGGILARRDEMVVIRGVNVYPSAVEDVLRACGGVAEYRVEIVTIRAMIELRLLVEPEPDAGDGLAHRLETALRDAFGLRIPVAIQPAGSLPRFEMKSRRWSRV
jgi:phenylacetate-CoA ligase